MFRPLFLRPLWKALLALAAATWLVLVWSDAELERQEERHLAEILPPRAALFAHALARALRDEPVQARTEWLEIARRGGMHLAWLDAAGRVRADSNPGENSVADLSALPEVHAVLGGANRGFAFDVERGHAAAVVPLEGSGAREYLRVSQPLLALERRQEGLRIAILSGAAALALLLAGILAYHARRIARDGRRLARQAESIGGGDVPREIHLGERSVLATLVPSLQRLADGLGARIETLAQDRNQLRAILASMVEGVVAVDTQGIVLHSNAVAGEILRMPPALARGRRLRETTRVREISELLDQVLATGESAEREAALPSLQQPRVVQLRASALEDARGTRAGAVVVIHDISTLRRLEEMRRDFVANVSHELKTPLTAIQGFVETILGDPEMPDALRQRFLERIQAQSERLYLLVQDLLALARIEAPRSALELEPIDPRPSLQRALDTVQSAAEARGVAVRAEIEDPAPRIEGDPEALEQIATNLLDNAVKYSRERGRVALRFFARGEDAILEVEDDGIGIEERHQRRIFERFYRVDKARSRDVGGTGLGLAIVKHLALALGGEVAVRSQLGQGSTFTVRLPQVVD